VARLRHADWAEYVRVREQSGKHILELSSSQFDPEQTFGLISLAEKLRGAPGLQRPQSLLDIAAASARKV